MNIDNYDLSKFNRLKSKPRHVSGYSYVTNFELLIRINPFTVFSTSIDSHVELKMYLVRNYLGNKLNNNLSKVLKNVPSQLKFLSFCVSNFDHIKLYFIKMYETNSTWDIAKILNVSQTTIRTLLGPNNMKISSRSMRCSKIHIKTKPIIENLLGKKSITEYYVGKFWIDEYFPELNLGIEIDGSWCHNEDRDELRDKIILDNYNIRIIRIPAYSKLDSIKLYLIDYL